MNKIEDVSKMTDGMLEIAARREYHSLPKPSSNLKFLYDTWLGDNRPENKKVRRVHSETIYRLVIYERDYIEITEKNL